MNKLSVIGNRLSVIGGKMVDGKWLMVNEKEDRGQESEIRIPHSETCSPDRFRGRLWPGSGIRNPNHQPSTNTHYALLTTIFLCFLFSPYLAHAQQEDPQIMAEIHGLKKDNAELKERVAKIEGTLEQMNDRMNHFGDTLNTLMIVTITMWVTTILCIVGLFITIIFSSRKKVSV